CHQAACSPHRHVLNDPLGTEPHGRIWKARRAFRTFFEHDGLYRSRGTKEDFPHRPRSGRKCRSKYRIERSDYSSATQGHYGLLERASVELGEHLSMRPSSTARARGGWLGPPP